jgi:RNA polymerase sigma-70 factor (ECF subfamily)
LRVKRVQEGDARRRELFRLFRDSSRNYPDEECEIAMRANRSGCGTIARRRHLIHAAIHMSSPLDFESLAKCYYRDLYYFAFSLAGNEAEASDLVQETFYTWATKGDQLREFGRAKSWLFTTLHRVFLQIRRRRGRFQEESLDEADHELPRVSPEAVARIDSATALGFLAKLDERYRAPLALYYLEDYSYLEISSILDVPLGTVQSRINRGKTQLLAMLTSGTAEAGAKGGTS